MNELFQQSRATPHPFGNRPLISLIGIREEPRPDGVPQAEWDALFHEKVAEKRAFGDLSTNSRVEEDPQAGHAIQLEDPATVVAAIRDVLDAAEQGIRLAK